MPENNRIAIGADIGGGHISCAAVDLSTHSIIAGTASYEPVNNKASAGEILGSWSKALSSTLSLIDRTKLAGIGFAMPGPFDYANGIALFERVEKYESLFGVNVSAELRKQLQLDDSLPLRYINDATAFAIAEAWAGKGAGHSQLVALTLGTGFGSAFISNGVPVLEGGTVPEMGCAWHIAFKDGIADDYFSTRWFTRNYSEKTGHHVNGVKEIAERADSDPIAAALFMEYGSNLGSFLAPIINNFGAQAIVIGGNITGAFGLFGHALTGKLAENGSKAEVLLSELKEDAAVTGGARLLSDDYWLQVKDLLSKM